MSDAAGRVLLWRVHVSERCPALFGQAAGVFVLSREWRIIPASVAGCSDLVLRGCICQLSGTCCYVLYAFGAAIQAKLLFSPVHSGVYFLPCRLPPY